MSGIFRRDAGQCTLAAAAGVSRETVRTVETMSRASLQTLQKLADALECQLTIERGSKVVSHE